MSTFSHSGDLGDVIYSLPVIRALGGGDLVLTSGTGARVREPMTWEKMVLLRELLERQDYIGNVSYAGGRPARVTHDLDRFRLRRRRNPNQLLVDWHLQTWGLPTSHRDAPWLRVPPKFNGPAVLIARSERWQTDGFPWRDVVAAIERSGRSCGFIGTPAECSAFDSELGLKRGSRIEYVRTNCFLQVAERIAASSLFIGNQSAPLAVALGLGHTCVIEAYPGREDCSLPRTNVIACPPASDPAKLVADLLGSREWTTSPSSS